MIRRPDTLLLIAGGLLFVVGQGMGLWWSPPDVAQGDAARLMYTHVPTAILSMTAYMIAMVCALASLFAPASKWDAALEASVEVGVVQNALLLIIGSIWSRPTFGVWWEWEPRITFSLIMFIAFVGVMLLRQIVEEADKRSLWSAVVTVMSSVTVPLTYGVVTRVATLHQEMSNPSSLSPAILVTLRVNLLAFVLLTLWMIAARARVARARALAEAPAPLPPGRSA